MRAIRISPWMVPSFARARAASLDARCPLCFSGLACFHALLRIALHFKQRVPLPLFLLLSQVNSRGNLATLHAGQVNGPVLAISSSDWRLLLLQQKVHFHPFGLRGHSAWRVCLPHLPHKISLLSLSCGASFDDSICSRTRLHHSKRRADANAELFDPPATLALKRFALSVWAVLPGNPCRAKLLCALGLPVGPAPRAFGLWALEGHRSS